jgi:hypothetical protein
MTYKTALNLRRLVPAGQVRFGFAGRGQWGVLDQVRSGEPAKGVVPVHPVLIAEIKFYGRHKAQSIRDGVLLDVVASQAGVRVLSVRPAMCSCSVRAVNIAAKATISGR